MPEVERAEFVEITAEEIGHNSGMNRRNSGKVPVKSARLGVVAAKLR